MVSKNDYELTDIKTWLTKNAHRKITFVDMYPNQENAINKIIVDKKQEMAADYNN